MIEIGPSLHKVDYDTAWLYTATLTHKDKYEWRWPTLSDFRHVHNIPNPIWYQGYRLDQLDTRNIYPVRDI
jgi:hypothetical protein